MNLYCNTIIISHTQCANCSADAAFFWFEPSVGQLGRSIQEEWLSTCSDDLTSHCHPEPSLCVLSRTDDERNGTDITNNSSSKVE